jgi:actin-like ATPase involved in cell morphogenesis
MNLFKKFSRDMGIDLGTANTLGTCARQRHYPEGAFCCGRK